MRIWRKIMLWLWDKENGDTLALAQRRQTILMGHGQKSARLQFVIDKMISEREEITQKEGSK